MSTLTGNNLGPVLGQAINLAFNEYMAMYPGQKVDLAVVRERAKDILMLNVELNGSISKGINTDSAWKR